MSDTGGAVQTRLFLPSIELLVINCVREKRLVEKTACGFPQQGTPRWCNRYIQNCNSIKSKGGAEDDRTDSVAVVKLSGHDLHARRLERVRVCVLDFSHI